MTSRTASVESKLAHWRQNLLDLSPENPILTFLPEKEDPLRISHPGIPTILDRLVPAGQVWEFWLPPVDDDAEVSGATAPWDLERYQPGEQELVCADLGRVSLLATLEDLYRRAGAEFLDRGHYPLHLVLGILEWADTENRPLHSPLLLVPVTLERAGQKVPFSLRGSGAAPYWNPALVHRIDQEQLLPLPALPQSWEPQTLADFLATLTKTLSGPKWRLETAAYLALLPVFRKDLAGELEANADRISAHPLVRVLAGETSASAPVLPEEEELEAIQDPEATFWVVDADAGQRLCLEAAARGESFILDGAPGTGKTQTIVNIIAGALARSQTILVVSDDFSARQALASRLCQVGLGEFCQDLTRPEKGKSRGFEDSAPATLTLDWQKLKACRDQLSRQVEAMHAVREPLKRSVWSVVNELAKLEGVPGLPLGLAAARTDGLPETAVVVTEVGPSWLEEARHAVQRFQQLWHIQQEADFPWRGFKAERFNKQLRDEVTSLLERIRSRLDKLQAAAEQLAGQMGCQGSVAWLLKVSEVLEANPGNVPVAWLREPDLTQVAQDLDRCAGQHQDLGQGRTPLTARYGQGIWHLPEGTAAQVERAWRQAAPLLAPGDDEGAGLLARQGHLRGWAADTQKRLPSWITEVRALEKWLGINLPAGAGGTDPAPRHLPLLQRLAHLCMSENPPEKSWVLDAKILEETRALIASSRPMLADYQQRRRKILEIYKESFFELDLARMAEGFAGPYQSRLRIFNGQFRRDRRAIRRRTRSEMVTATMAQDVVAGRDVLALRAALDAEQPRRQSLLGRYEKGLETSFEAADRAARIAAEAVDLVHQLGYESLPSRFVELLCSGGSAPEKIRAADKRLHDSLAAWQRATQELKAHLPMECLPGTGRPLEDCSLSVVLNYARDLQAGLNPFAHLTTPVLSGAPTPPADTATLLADLKQAEEIRSWENTRDQEPADWQSRLGPAFKGLATDWNALRKAMNWTRRLRELFQGVPPEPIVQLAGGGKAPSSRELRSALEQYQQALHALEIRFDSPGPLLEGKPLGDNPPEAAKKRLAVLRERVGELADWIDWRLLPTRFRHLGLGAFWNELLKTTIPADQVPSVFLKSFWQNWLETVLEAEPGLKHFHGREHERLRADFQDLDRAWQKHNVMRITHQVKNRQLQTPTHPDGKPCVLVHALGAWQLFCNQNPPAGPPFDLVIFDQAGRTSLEEALPAISRGHQIIVAGDLQQPSRIGDGMAMSESLQEACARAGLLRLRLRWHYSSHRETLIDFANQHFYNNGLGTFPAPFRDHPDRGVQFQHVTDGLWENGQNLPEARAVADLACAHLLTAPEKSLGIVAGQPSQRKAILQEIQCRLRDRPELARLFEGDSFLVEDLAHVPAKQRDVMVWSLGYGRNRQGMLPGWLPPFDQADGNRWLNLAITRAREKLIVVSSLLPEDFPESPGLENQALLRQFLAYAQKPLELSRDLPEPEPLEKDILRELQERGYPALPQYGHDPHRLDIAVLDPDSPGRFLLGLELDGPNYAAASASDRDRLRSEVLQALGWRLHRIWALDWLSRRQEEIDRLCGAIEESRQKSPKAPDFSSAPEQWKEKPAARPSLPLPGTIC